MSNPIDEYVKRNLGEQEIKPSKNLFAEKISPRIEQRQRKVFPYMRVAAAVVLLLAAYALIQLVNKPATQGQPLDITPVAVDEPQMLDVITIMPAIDESNTEQELVPVLENVDSKTVASTETKTKLKRSKTQPTQAIMEQSTTLAAADITKPEQENMPASKPAKSYKIKIKIDPAKYAVTEETTTATADARTTVGQYAKDQIKNIKQGEGLDAPPKDMLNLPKLGLRVDGNPLKKILTRSEATE